MLCVLLGKAQTLPPLRVLSANGKPVVTQVRVPDHEGLDTVLCLPQSLTTRRGAKQHILLPPRPAPAGPPPSSSYLPQTFRVHNRRGRWWKRTVLCARNAEDGRGNRHPHWSRGAVAARNRSRSRRAAVSRPKDGPGVPRGPPLASGTCTLGCDGQGSGRERGRRQGAGDAPVALLRAQRRRCWQFPAPCLGDENSSRLRFFPRRRLCKMGKCDFCRPS